METDKKFKHTMFVDVKVLGQCSNDLIKLTLEAKKPIANAFKSRIAR